MTQELYFVLNFEGKLFVHKVQVSNGLVDIFSFDYFEFFVNSSF